MSMAPGRTAPAEEPTDNPGFLALRHYYRSRFAERGMVFSGIHRGLDLVEVIEIPGHPHFIGCQFHPEFKSKPFAPHPLFAGFIRAALAYREQCP